MQAVFLQYKLYLSVSVHMKTK